MRPQVLTLVAVLLLVHCSGGDMMGGDPTAVHGTVTVVGTGSPISGVAVSIDSILSNTGQDGGFQLLNIESGQRTIRATRAGFDSYEQTISVSSPDTLYDIPLAVSVPGGSVSGAVFDADTGERIAGATVTLAGLMVLSDATGEYLFPSVPQGTHEIMATHAEYLGAIGGLFVSSADRVFNFGLYFPYCFEGNWFEGEWQDEDVPSISGPCSRRLVERVACDCSNDPCVIPRDRIVCRFLMPNSFRRCVDFDPASRTAIEIVNDCILEVEFSRGGPAALRWRHADGSDAGEYPGQPRTSAVPDDLGDPCL